MVTRPSPAPPGPCCALAGEPDLRAVLDAVRKLEVDRLAVRERDPLRLQRRRIDEWNGQPIGDVRALLRRPRTLPEAAEPAAATPPAAAEQTFEQVAEIGRVA